MSCIAVIAWSFTHASNGLLSFSQTTVTELPSCSLFFFLWDIYLTFSQSNTSWLLVPQYMRSYFPCFPWLVWSSLSFFGDSFRWSTLSGLLSVHFFKPFISFKNPQFLQLSSVLTKSPIISATLCKIYLTYLFMFLSFSLVSRMLTCVIKFWYYSLVFYGLVPLMVGNCISPSMCLLTTSLNYATLAKRMLLTQMISVWSKGQIIK